MACCRPHHLLDPPVRHVLHGPRGRPGLLVLLARLVLPHLQAVGLR
jgi:hypothetical protein